MGLMTVPRFDPTFNLGHIFTSLAFLGSFGGIIFWQSGFQTRTEERLMAEEMSRKQYVPIVNDLVTIQATTTTQLTNVTAVLAQMQTVNREQEQAISAVRERMAAIEAVSRKEEKP